MLRTNGRNRKVLAAFLVLLALAAIFLVGGLFQSKEKQALALSGQNEFVKAFAEKNSNYTSNVTQISAAEVKALAEKYPAIYGDLPQKSMLYLVTYEKDRTGYTCFVDMDAKKTLKCVRALNIGLKFGE